MPSGAAADASKSGTISATDVVAGGLTAEDALASDLLHAMHFLGLTDAQVRSDHPARRLSRIDRGSPVDTAGDRCLWHAGGTAEEGDLAQARQPWSLARPQGNPGV